MLKICSVGCTLVIFQNVLFMFVTGICRDHRENPYVLRGKKGTIQYTVTLAQEDCSWLLPPSPDNQHALIIYVKSISARNGGSRCTGNLYLPGVEPSCKQSSICRVYVPTNSTCTISDIAEKSYKVCTKNVIYMNENSRKEIRFRSDKKSEKSFSITFKYVDCSKKERRRSRTLNSGLKPPPTSPSLTPEETPNSTAASPPNAGSKTDGQDSFPAAFAAIVSIIVLLAILLVATCIMLYLMYRRKKKAVTFQNPAVVAYVHELSEDGTNAAHRRTEYLETTSAPVHSQSNRDIYAEIGGRKNSETLEFSSLDLSEPHYQNFEVINQESQDTTSSSLGSTSRYAYATVNKTKRRDLPDVAV